MTDILNKIDRRIAELNLSSPEQVKQLFDDLRDKFVSELGEKIDPKYLEEMRVRWIGRSEHSIRRRVLANWLKVESPLRQHVGQYFQELLADDGFLVKKLSDHRVAALAHEEAQYPVYPNALRQQDSPSHSEAAVRQQNLLAGADDVVGPWAEQNTAPELAFLPEDLSLPGVIRPIGSHHLIRQVFQEIEDMFVSIGFSVVEGPEIETPYYNFEALNIPEFHPVRDDMDTFYLELPKGAPTPLLLRTHTSPMQIRTMEKQKPPCV